MKQKSSLRYVFLLLLVSVFFLVGCGEGESANPVSQITKITSKNSNNKPNNNPDIKRVTNTAFLQPDSSGEVCYEGETVSIDASNTSEGYVMVKYTGASAKAKLQITIPDSTVYTYALVGSDYETFPLTGGDGSYHLDILENVVDDMYALVFSQDITVSLADEFKPYLYPNQYAWYTSDSEVPAFGITISEQSSSDLDYLEQIYLYVIKNVVYDTEKATNIPLNYIPDIDQTLSSKKGICFDYAALMTALLRSQGIPTKLVVGYSGEAYHAWISVYLEEVGWVDNIIEFDGKSWSLMDPTLAANNSSSSVGKYIGDGSNYLAKYYY